VRVKTENVADPRSLVVGCGVNEHALAGQIRHGIGTGRTR
jgi:hypothetical protein